MSTPHSFIRLAHWPTVLGMMCVMLCEGYDLIVYSSLIPVLIVDAGMDVDRAAAGFIGSATFLGMFLGGLIAGSVKHRFGYLLTIGVGVIWFSIAVGAAAFAPNGIVLGFSRALAGLGLGVVLPVAMSFARAHAFRRGSALAISIVMAGIPLGGLLAAFTCSVLLPELGWRFLMLMAGVIGFAVLAGLTPFLARKATRKKRLQDSAPCREARKASDVLRRPERLQLYILAAITFLFLLAYYGMSTWLAQLMREFNLPLENSLQMMVILNFGCVIGSLFTAWLATTVPVRFVTLACAVLAALCLFGIAMNPESAVIMMSLVFLAGVGAISAQNLTNALVSNTFREDVRASALGFTLGVGRLGAVASPAAGGIIIQSGLDAGYVFALLAIADLLGALLLLKATHQGKTSV